MIGGIPTRLNEAPAGRYAIAEGECGQVTATELARDLNRDAARP
jgi:hypothetical protein